MRWSITRLDTVDSTNEQALARMRSGAARAGEVLVAAEQTAGRGRPGRTWHSPRGALLMTAILPFYPELVGWTALSAGIAVARAARDLGVPAGVKWPNDVVLDGRKLAGILVETCAPDLAAVGIGMNVVNARPPDPGLAARTARLADSLPGVSVEIALAGVLERLAECWRLLEAAETDELRRAWEVLDTTAGRRVRWSEGGLVGTALGIAPDGALWIQAEDGQSVTAAVGEILFL